MSLALFGPGLYLLLGTWAVDIGTQGTRRHALRRLVVRPCEGMGVDFARTAGVLTASLLYPKPEYVLPTDVHGLSGKWQGMRLIETRIFSESDGTRSP